MWLSGLCIALALFVTFRSSDACIPTKTPEPGIPATMRPPSLFILLTVVATLFLASSDACVPTKTPQPGIPATTTTVKPAITCNPPITAYPPADCMAVFTPKGKMCGEADITPTMVSCLPGWTVYYVSPTKTGTLADVFKCVGTTWMVSGFPLSQFTGAGAVQVACVSS
ncbi:hypothetical protein PRIPAC_78076 [Pristionchus pacificus]|uniref:Uncharacterized protein n=1 Tax=Pristionchus pacificus TaxID=54126 RepID=A0A2A6CM89_PRIPA|nr:hypothetical protein PRIPAC_78076 [Pristionchus pacificus]|eukprot:PDM79324.1 hypothetical protein PRIPAC_31903 [Pristionchus pacificus]